MLCIRFYNLFYISFMVCIFPERKILFLMDLSMDIFQDFLARILGDSISEKLTGYLMILRPRSAVRGSRLPDSPAPEAAGPDRPGSGHIRLPEPGP